MGRPHQQRAGAILSWWAVGAATHSPIPSCESRQAIALGWWRRGIPTALNYLALCVLLAILHATTFPTSSLSSCLASILKWNSNTIFSHWTLTKLVDGPLRVEKWQVEVQNGWVNVNVFKNLTTGRRTYVRILSTNEICDWIDTNSSSWF